MKIIITLLLTIFFIIVGCNKDAEVITEIITVEKPIPVIVNDPIDTTVDPSYPASFSVDVVGGDFSYQWYKNNKPLYGEHSPALHIERANISDSGSIYNCKIYNETDSVFCNSGILHVRPFVNNPLTDIYVNTGTVLDYTIETDLSDVSFTWCKYSPDIYDDRLEAFSYENNISKNINKYFTSSDSGKALFYRIETPFDTLYSESVILHVIPKTQYLTRMKLIPAKNSTFMMGDTIDYNFTTSSYPALKVSFTYDFYMDSSEITVKEFFSVVNSNTVPAGYKTPYLSDFTHISNDFPIHGINFYDAVIYCNNLSKSHGLDTVYTYTEIINNVLRDLAIDTSKNGYRLPYEAEWEYACRAGSTTDYYWNRSMEHYIDNPDSIDEIYDYVFRYKSSSSQFTEVCQYLPNSYGLYDMIGNVNEMCNGGGFIYRFKEGKELIDPHFFDGSNHINRGHWYVLNGLPAPASTRISVKNSDRLGQNGFRVVKRVQ